MRRFKESLNSQLDLSWEEMSRLGPQSQFKILEILISTDLSHDWLAKVYGICSDRLNRRIQITTLHWRLKLIDFLEISIILTSEEST